MSITSTGKGASALTPALDDVLLVLLAQQPASAYDLRQRHELVFGSRQAVDIGRIKAVVNRLARSEHLRADGAALRRRDNNNRPVLVLTAAGHRRQERWLLTIPAEADPEDFYVRGILAVEAADPTVIDTFVRGSLAVIRVRQQELNQAMASQPLPAKARISFEYEMIRALVLWLHQLPGVLHG